MLFSKLRLLVSCRGKKVVILLQKLELELVISDCNVIQQLNEMIETRTRCVAISGGGKICYQLLATTVRSKMNFVEEDCSAKEATVC